MPLLLHTVLDTLLTLVFYRKVPLAKNVQNTPLTPRWRSRWPPGADLLEAQQLLVPAELDVGALLYALHGHLPARGAAAADVSVSNALHSRLKGSTQALTLAEVKKR